jgi:hypothetical protein
MWAALQGKGGIIDDAELALLIFGNEAATAESVLGQHPSITEMPGSDISDLSVRMDRVEQIAILAYASAPSAGSGSGGSSSTGSWIPLTDGSEPPNFITDGAGSLILVWYDP